MNRAQIRVELLECFDQVMGRYLFEPDTPETRHNLVCEFVEKCAQSGHGIQAEALDDAEQMRGIRFMHEDGYSGTITIGADIQIDTTQ